MAEFASILDAWGVESLRGARKGRQGRGSGGGRPGASAAAAMAAAGLAECGPEGGSGGFGAASEPYEPYSDRFMYVRPHPRGREPGGSAARAAVLSEAMPAPYDTAPQGVQGRGAGGVDMAALPPQGAFMEYDDFYGQDLQYASLVDAHAEHQDLRAAACGAGNSGSVAQEQQRAHHALHQQPPPLQEQQGEARGLAAAEGYRGLAEGYADYAGSAAGGVVAARRGGSAHDPRYVYDMALYTLSGAFLILVLEQFLQLGRMMR